MYSHYFFTSLGYENPFKKLITQAQLIQFAMCIVHALCVLGFEVVLPRPYAWAQFVYHIQVSCLTDRCYSIRIITKFEFSIYISLFYSADARAVRALLPQVVLGRQGSQARAGRGQGQVALPFALRHLYVLRGITRQQRAIVANRLCSRT